MKPTGIIFVLAGLFSAIGAIGNWDWFMESRKARIWIKLFGRRGARVFYIILRAVFIMLGVLFSVGIIG